MGNKRSELRGKYKGIIHRKSITIKEIFTSSENQFFSTLSKVN
jgi:hypothetical protein